MSYCYNQFLVLSLLINFMFRVFPLNNFGILLLLSLFYFSNPSFVNVSQIYNVCGSIFCHHIYFLHYKYLLHYTRGGHIGTQYTQSLMDAYKKEKKSIWIAIEISLDKFSYAHRRNGTYVGICQNPLLVNRKKIINLPLSPSNKDARIYI